jgi:putative transposase
MQVFGLPGHVVRNGGAASRLLDAKTPTIEAARRREAVARWRRAAGDERRPDGRSGRTRRRRSPLDAYRWRTSLEPRSRRPKRPRRPQWPPALSQTVEAARADNPMWSKGKLAKIRRQQGFAASMSTVGRILRKLVERGAVTPVPILHRPPGARSLRLTPARSLRQAPRQRPQGQDARRTRPDRQALRQPSPRQAHQALHRL